jgi:hypothetical protein
VTAWLEVRRGHVELSPVDLAPIAGAVGVRGGRLFAMDAA